MVSMGFPKESQPLPFVVCSQKPREIEVNPIIPKTASTHPREPDQVPRIRNRTTDFEQFPVLTPNTKLVFPVIKPLYGLS